MEINLEDVFSEENNLSAEAAKLRYHLVEDHVNDVITIFNLDLKTIFKSPSIMQLRGFTPKEAKQQTLDQIMAPDDAALFQKTLLEELALEAESKANHKRAIILEAEEYKKDGSTIVVETKLSFLRKDNGVAFGIIAVSRDITERKRLSITDDLTQLYNSKYFYNQLGKEIERSNRHEQPLTLLMLDIDKFKDFNDMYGHIDGDNVLLLLGQVLKRCLRETDSAYRYGGEEFTIILPMTTKEDGITTAEESKRN